MPEKSSIFNDDGYISIITHIGAVAAQPERPSAYTGGRALARQPAADEGAHGNATVDTAGPGVWAQRRMTGARGLTGNGLSAPLVTKEASRYATTPSLRSTVSPALEQIAPQTQQHAARHKRQQSAEHRLRHAAHRARKHKTKPAAPVARKSVLAPAEVSGADIMRSSAAGPPSASASAVPMPANSLMAPTLTPAANLMALPAPISKTCAAGGTPPTGLVEPGTSLCIFPRTCLAAVILTVLPAVCLKL